MTVFSQADDQGMFISPFLQLESQAKPLQAATYQLKSLVAIEGCNCEAKTKANIEAANHGTEELGNYPIGKHRKIEKKTKRTPGRQRVTPK